MSAPGAGLRVGIAGVGAMAIRHAEAVLDAGGEVAALLARPTSTRVDAFTERFGVVAVHPDAASFAAEAATGAWDAAIVAVSTDAAGALLDALAPTGAPLLIEKPGATSSAALAAHAGAAAPILVGYNRRFYAPVLAAREFAQGGGPVIATLALPEKVVTRPDGAGIDPRPFLENSVHGLDLLRHLLGPLTVVSTTRPEGGAGLVATLTSARGDVISLVSAWGSPSNFALDLARDDERFELRPFELGRRYRGMDVEPPEPGVPIKRYVPRAVEQVMLSPEDARVKPGFRQQIDALARVVRGEPEPVAARLADAVADLRLAETLLGPEPAGNASPAAPRQEIA